MNTILRIDAASETDAANQGPAITSARVGAHQKGTEVPGSSNEPASQTNESGQQRDEDRQKWGWIHHCDEVISHLPIGLA